MCHLQINKIIDACVMDFGLAPHRSSSEDEEDPIKVILVENGAKELRGFAGFDEIYIHAAHFQDKIDTFPGDVELLQLICKIDVISLSIHELSHIKMRKVSISKASTGPILLILSQNFEKLTLQKCY